MNFFLILAIPLTSLCCFALAAQTYEVHSPSLEPSGGALRSSPFSMEGRFSILSATNSGGRFEIRNMKIATLAEFPSKMNIDLLPDGRLLLSWLEAGGLEIDLEWKENLLDSSWTRVVPRPVRNSLVVIPSDSQRFYRLRLR